MHEQGKYENCLYKILSKKTIILKVSLAIEIKSYNLITRRHNVRHFYSIKCLFLTQSAKIRQQSQITNNEVTKEKLSVITKKRT